MKKKSNRKFYTLCNPTVNNDNTGNLCFSIKDLERFDKDFIYKDKVVSKELVRDNMKFIYGHKEDKSGVKTTYPICIIPKKIVELYGEVA